MLLNVFKKMKTIFPNNSAELDLATFRTFFNTSTVELLVVVAILLFNCNRPGQQDHRFL